MTTNNQNNIVHMELKNGTVIIKLRPDLAPLAAERIRVLAEKGFYDGTPFHRVIEGFMAQGGDPSGTGTKGSDLPDLPAEFTKEESFRRGMIGMARTMDPNSANSQFFIMFADAPHLNGQYTIVGEVTQGMELVDQIKRGGGANGMVNDPDRIIKMSVVAE
ncbi:peptidylprolyl isomerase [Commensalibacter oyaizuii]|uniref:Peptidyl-prolyl cis-trans isomerase n=1 Tax=Commensalibacter oyaizuii TaxID=3043873 RepID=A0ABT6PYW8_9PROT|nr:peptidylprolyl isomerase [Commensalibacter sp. TBRC 16381]MDI2089920.1 peptidylprolyl isomerase [Commensalibacter sp. TBRC 16381]